MPSGREIITLNQDSVLLEVVGGVATITLNRPHKHNALTRTMLERMLSIFDAIDQDDALRVVLLRAAGPSFCSGLDLSEMRVAREDQGAVGFDLLLAVFNRLFRHRNPTVAMVHGTALAGGCELALHCDIRIGSPAARFGMPLARLGIVVPFLQAQRLIETIGDAGARDLLLTADSVDGTTAAQLGLLTRLEPSDALVERTEQLVSRMAVNAPLAMREMKRVINTIVESWNRHDYAEFDDARIRVTESEDTREGLRAFIERRAPMFRGV